VQLDPRNDGAYYNRAMCLINERDFFAAKQDLSMVLRLDRKVDVECLVKRAYCSRLLGDFKACSGDMELAQSECLRGASQVPEFVSIHKYIAQQNIIKKNFPAAIGGLSAAISVLPEEMTPPLRLWRSLAYFSAGRAHDYI